MISFPTKSTGFVRKKMDLLFLKIDSVLIVLKIDSVFFILIDPIFCPFFRGPKNELPLLCCKM